MKNQLNVNSSAKMLSLLSSSNVSLHLTQIAHAYIMLNSSCNQIGLWIRRMCYHIVIIGLLFMTVPKTEFHVFGKKAFRIFRGAIANNANWSMSLFGAFLFSENHFCPFWGMLQNRGFGVKWGRCMSKKSGFLVFRKKLLPKMGHKTAQNDPKWPKTACACPFFGHSCFRKKTFVKIRTCKIMCIFTTYARV